MASDRRLIKAATPKEFVIVLPSLKISGGVLEALNLSRRIIQLGGSSRILTMWESNYPVGAENLSVMRISSRPAVPNRAFLDLPFLFMKFFMISERKKCAWIFTHYATLLFFFAVPRENRYIFVQDLEWRFVKRPALRALLKWFILFCYGRGKLITTNCYLSAELKREAGLESCIAPIWADRLFYEVGKSERDIDILMVLRQGAHKRLDLYFSAIDFFAERSASCRLGVVTTEDIIARDLASRDISTFLRPSGVKEMLSIYSRSKIMLHLSDHEGFALPPLEAMGSGCVPVCRNSGGPTVYLKNELEILLRPANEPIESVFALCCELLEDHARWESLSERCREAFRAGSATVERSSRLAVAELLAGNI